MKKSRFTEAQMVGMLRVADRTSLAAVAETYDVSEQTLYTWRQQFGVMGSSDVKRLRQPEQENSRLRKLVADRDLEIEVMKDIAVKKCLTYPPAANRWPTPGCVVCQCGQRVRC